jgi:hypothetical protein
VPWSITLPRPDEAAQRYLRALTGRLHQGLPESLVGVYLIGSAATGDYLPGRSDLDVAVVVERTLDARTKRRLVSLLSHDALPCPARMLELVVYPAEVARSGALHPAYELNLNTGPSGGTRAWFDPAGPDAEPRHWFVVDLASAAEIALVLDGPPAGEVFAPAPREGVRMALLSVLDWQMSNEPIAPNTVLNACRAWRWAETGRWGSKSEAGRWGRRRVGDPSPIDAALAARRGEAPPPADADATGRIVAMARSALDGADDCDR